MIDAHNLNKKTTNLSQSLNGNIALMPSSPNPVIIQPQVSQSADYFDANMKHMLKERQKIEQEYDQLRKHQEREIQKQMSLIA